LLLFLCGLPQWLAAIILVILPTALAMCGPMIVRSKVDLARLSTNNEIAGFKFATVGVIYAVLLAFAVIAVWDKFSEAESAVVKEAGASAAIYRLTAGPESEATATRAALNNYLNLAINLDWPQMAAEKESKEATHALDALYVSAMRMAENGRMQPTIIGEIFNNLGAITEARRVRLHLATGVVPGGIWLVLVCGAVLTVGFTFFFGTKNLSAQVMMTGILSVIVFMGIFVILSFDHPFTGGIHVGNEPLRAAIEDFQHN
jgi:hypothetical protein